MLKKVRIQIITDRYEVQGSLYDAPTAPALFEQPAPEAEVEHTETTVEGRYHDSGDRISIGYKETELSGMEGSSTSVSFQKSAPAIVSMLRDGSVKTALIFERGKRHLCVYQTQIMPFEVCVFTKRVDNRLDTEGTLEMDYTVEIRGAQAERTRFQMRVLPYFDKPAQK